MQKLSVKKIFPGEDQSYFRKSAMFCFLIHQRRRKIPPITTIIIPVIPAITGRNKLPDPVPPTGAAIEWFVSGCTAGNGAAAIPEVNDGSADVGIAEACVMTVPVAGRVATVVTFLPDSFFPGCYGKIREPWRSSIEVICIGSLVIEHRGKFRPGPVMISHQNDILRLILLVNQLPLRGLKSGQIGFYRERLLNILARVS